MEVSSTSMNAARATDAAISHGFTLGFQTACRSTLGFCICVGRAPAPDPLPEAAGPEGGAGNVVSIADNSFLLGDLEHCFEQEPRSCGVRRIRESGVLLS